MKCFSVYSQEWNKVSPVNCFVSRLHELKQILQGSWMNVDMQFVLDMICLAVPHST
jgi:hypothetical protein